MKPVVPRVVAEQDIERAVSHYLKEAGPESAVAFVDALEKATAHISRHPGYGSSKYAVELRIPGLRHWPLRKFPYLILYVEFETVVEVWRILHAHSDIPAWMESET